MADDEIECLTKKPGQPSLTEIQSISRNYIIDNINRKRKLGDVVNKIEGLYQKSLNSATLENIGRAYSSVEKYLGQETNVVDQVKKSAIKLNPANEYISSHDLNTLQPNEWLNDNVVNEYLRLLTRDQDGPFIAISSFFVETFKFSKIEKIPDLDNRIAFIPVCLNSHWSMIVAFQTFNALVIFTSMHNIVDESDFMMFSKVREHLQNTTMTSWSLKVYPLVKSQSNSDDCGVFILGWARCIMERPEMLNQLSATHMPKLRKLIRSELHRNELSDFDIIFPPLHPRIKRQLTKDSA